MQHQGALPGAVGTEYRQPLAGFDLEIDSGQGLPSVWIGEPQPLHLHRRRHCITRAIVRVIIPSRGRDVAFSQSETVAGFPVGSGITPV